MSVSTRENKRRKIKEKRKETLNEIRHLVKECGVPIKSVAKRVRLSYSKVRRIIKKGTDDPEVAFTRMSAVKKFDKIHERARLHIKSLFENTDHPLTLREVQTMLLRKCQLRVSRPTLGKYMREELNATYKNVRAIKSAHNHPSAKLQRQYAASQMIKILHSGKKIINIDESVVKFTDHRSRGWIQRSKRNLVTNNIRLEGINIICALASTGDVSYTVNSGKTNSDTFAWFIVKMVEHLDSADRHWRSNTVFMVDNAQYHRSESMKQIISKLNIPWMFMGPYQFRVAPVEMVFNYVKQHPLNPLHSRISSR